MLTNKGKYGLKAMVFLAGLTEPGTAQVAAIAERNRIPKKFLDTILLDLRNAGMLRSKKGPGGGYGLAKPASQIMVGTIIRTLDGPLAPISCASRTAFQPCLDCADLDTCPVRLIMTDVRDAMSRVLDGTSLDDLVARGLIGDVVLDPVL
jgi:Rrf2 family protein